MPNKRTQFYFILLAIDFNLLNISFFALNYWKRGFVLSPMYVKLLFALYLMWLGVSFLTDKFRFDPNAGYWGTIILYAKATRRRSGLRTTATLDKTVLSRRAIIIKICLQSRCTRHEQPQLPREPQRYLPTRYAVESPTR